MVETHLKPNKKYAFNMNNKGSCRKYATYLTKENSFFFSHNREDIELEEAVSYIDEHSKGQLGLNDAKWYAPMYAFSSEESKHIAKKVTGREVQNFEELTDLEKKKYNKIVLEVARKFQDKMAENFNKSPLGINKGKDLRYIGVVENIRKYKGNDIEVIKKIKKIGDKKKGFQTHIHIIQSRKANNKKKSKISPESAAKNLKTKFGKVGFNRNNFYNLIEKTFDEELNFNRNLEAKFEYKKRRKLKNKLHESEDHFLKDVLKEINTFKSIWEESKLDNQKKYNLYFSKQEISYWESKIKISDYFFELEKKGKIKFKRENNNDFIFTDNESGKEIYVSKKTNKWNSFTHKKGGGIINAIREFENKNWKSAVWTLKDKFEQNVNNEANKKVEKKIHSKQKYFQELKLKKDRRKKNQENIKIITSKKVTSKKLLNNLLDIGGIHNKISLELEQVKYRTLEGKEFWSLGMKNLSGGYTIHNGKFESTIGKSDIIFKEGIKKESLLIFEKMEDYLKYTSIYFDGKYTSIPSEDFIILNSIDNIDSLEKIISKNRYQNILFLTGKDYIKNKIDAKISSKMLDYRNEYNKKNKRNNI